MNDVVMRREPSLPAWAWMSVVLAVLLLAGIVWWASSQPAVEPAPQRPMASSQPTPPSPASPPAAEQGRGTTQTPYGWLGDPKSSIDWSKPSADFLPAPPPRKQAAPKSDKIKVTVGKPAPKKAMAKAADADTTVVGSSDAGRLVIPPVPRLRPHAATPGRFMYNGTHWVLSSSPVATSEQVDLVSIGSVEGRDVYALSGEVSNPSVLFMETSPDSGHYNLYRPSE